ncbi:MAG: carbohydrate ABC transporter permease [Salinibacter sp.]
MLPRVTGWFTGANAGRSFLAPAIIILLVLTIFPFLFTVALTFSEVTVLGEFDMSFTGLDNWSQLFQNERFWNALRVTAQMVVIAVFFEYVFGLGLALLLDQQLPGTTFFRVLFLIPMMISKLAVGYMWRMMFGADFGPITGILQALGFSGQEWLTQTDTAIYIVILADIWEWTPFMLLILFAGLQGIPKDYKEAARIDGANAWQTFRHVIFPMLAPASIAALLIRTIEASKIVDKAYIMTGGGPGVSTETLTLFGYVVGLRNFNLAEGASIALSLFLMVLIISAVFIIMMRRY